MDEELVITRSFPFPIEKVWRAWTEAEEVKKWWGPKDFTTPVANIDFKVGGKNLICMRSLDGKDYWGTGVYKEIIPMEKIVVTDSFSDEKGNVVSSSYYGMEGFPEEMLLTVLFEEKDNQTKLTLRHSGIGGISTEDKKNMEEGWSQSFDKLEKLLENAS